MDGMELTRDQRADLFLLQVRGQMAMAFNHSGVIPSQAEWDILNGLTEPTSREIGEIAGRTGFNLYLQLHDTRKPA